jgi:hypothetical protein
VAIKGVIRNVGKKALNSAHSYFYDAAHKKEAIKAVHVIQKYNFQKLTPQLKKLADDYSVEVLGSKRYAPWLYVYTLIKGEFKEGWIPDNFFGKLVCPRINKELCAVTEFKSFSNIVLKTEALPDIAYYIDGNFYNREHSIMSIDTLREQIFASQKAVFVKKDCSNRGTGVSKITVEELNDDYFRRIGNCVIQSPIKQHEFFDDIVSGSVATIRITTVKHKSGRMDLRAAYLRLGRKDTSWVQSDNSVRVAIINNSGDLDSFGYTQNWRRWVSHPDTGFSFENRRIPKFEAAIEACIKLHNKVPHLTIIGWDITVGDDEKIKILEWNSNHCDIKFSEATTGPCFSGLGWEKYREK